MNLLDIQPGMTIEYRCYHLGKRIQPKTKTGTVRQVTDKLIAIQGQRYPDTILVNDLLSGQVEILKLGEGDNMAKEAPTNEVLQEVLDRKGTISRVAQELRVSMPTAKKWLIEAGILDSQGQPASQYTPADNEETGEPEINETSQNLNDVGQKPAKKSKPALTLPGSIYPLEPDDPRINAYGLGKPGVPPLVMPHAQELPKARDDSDNIKNPHPKLSDILTGYTYQRMIREQIAEWGADVFRMDIPMEVKRALLDKLLDLGVSA